MFLKRKQCGKVKACGCADLCKQRAYVATHDAASPTKSNEVVYIPRIIDAYEKQNVAIIDIPRLFM